MRGAVARPIDDTEHFAGVGERDDQRMVAPDAVVGDVHAGLAHAGGFRQGAVHVNGGAGEEVGRLLGPDPLPRRVDGVDERVDVGRPEPPAEVAGRGRVGDAACAQRVEEVRVLAAQFDVLQTGAVAQGVVGEIEHMIGFVVRQVQFEQVQAGINGLDQTATPRQQMEGPDAAAGDGARLVGYFVLNVAGRELRSQAGRVVFPIEAAFDSALAPGEPALENGVHLKSFL